MCTNVFKIVNIDQIWCQLKKSNSIYFLCFMASKLFVKLSLFIIINLYLTAYQIIIYLFVIDPQETTRPIHYPDPSIKSKDQKSKKEELIPTDMMSFEKQSSQSNQTKPLKQNTNQQIFQGQQLTINNTAIPEDRQQEGCEYPYQFYKTKDNSGRYSIVMLKQVKDIIPLLVIKPVFILYRCPIKDQEKVGAKFQFVGFDEIELMKQYIQSKLAREYIQILTPFKMAAQIGDELGQIDEIKKSIIQKGFIYRLTGTKRLSYNFRKRQEFMMKLKEISIHNMLPHQKTSGLFIMKLRDIKKLWININKLQRLHTILWENNTLNTFKFRGCQGD